MPGVPSAREAIQVAARAQRVGRGLARALSQGRLGEVAARIRACRKVVYKAGYCVGQKSMLHAVRSTQGDGAAGRRRTSTSPAHVSLALPARAPRPLRYPPPSRPFRRRTPISSPSSTISNGTMIPMRDGVRLFTIVYEPRDTTRIYPILSSARPTRSAPTSLTSIGASSAHHRSSTRTGTFSSSRTRVESSDPRASRGHAAVQAVEADAEVDESSDTHDTIEWLLKSVPRNNGRVGMWGISYPGWQTVMGMMNAHPASRRRLRKHLRRTCSSATTSTTTARSV